MAKKTKKDTQKLGEVFASAKTLIDGYYNRSVTLNGGKFSQYETLNHIEKYYAGKFLSGDTDSEGFKKFFYNIGAPRCDTFTKAIDLDSKNIRIDADNRLKGWLMQKELKIWTRKNNFGELANEISHALPIYGSVVVKSVGGKAYLVHLRNIINEQGAENLEDSDFIECHYYSPSELRKQSWDKDAIEEVIKQASEANKHEIAVYECWMFNKEGKRELYILGGTQMDPDKKVEEKELLNVQILFENPTPKWCYREHHLQRIFGRWLSMGLVEKLFDVQERVNEICNRLAKIEHWSSKQVFQTRDNLAQKNVLTDAFDGDIIQVTSEITKIAVEDRNAPNMREDLKMWLSQADKIAFSFEIATGENLPSGTPFRTAFIMQQAVSSYFGLQRQNFGLFLKEIFIDLIIPSFKKDSKKLHKMLISGGGNELSLFRRAIAEEMVKQQLANVIDRINTFEDLDAMIQETIQGLGEKFSIEVPDSFYEDLEYWMDFVITNESVDMDTRTTSITTALQILGANPALSQNPAMRELFSIGLAVGIGEEKAQEIMAIMEMNPMQAPEVAGSVAAPKQNELVKASNESAI